MSSQRVSRLFPEEISDTADDKTASRTLTQVVRFSVRNLVCILVTFQNVRRASSTGRCPRARSRGGAGASLSLPTGGRREPRRGEDPGLRVAEEGGAGARPVLRGRAGARGAGLGLGGFPERREFATRFSLNARLLRLSVPAGRLGQNERARALQGQPASAEPLSVRVRAKGPSLRVSVPHPRSQGQPQSLGTASTRQ